LFIDSFSSLVLTLFDVVFVCLLLTELVAALRDQRLPDGTTDSVGEVLINWVRLTISCASLYMFSE